MVIEMTQTELKEIDSQLDIINMEDDNLIKQGSALDSFWNSI